MRASCIVLCIYLLAGCASHYQPRPIDEAEAYAVVTQVAARNAESPYLDSRYLGFRDDAQAPAAGSTPQDIGERIYFNSLETVRLHRQGDHYLVRLSRVDGEALREFRVDDLQQAQRFVDALHYYRDNAPAFTGIK